MSHYRLPTEADMKRYFGEATIVATLLCAGLLPYSTQGQESTGTIIGTVIDASGAVVSGANVQVTNTGTNVSITVNTNPTGNFRIPFLPPGQYSVRVYHEGFKNYVRSGIELRVASAVDLQLPLQPGAVSEKITVTAEKPQLETADGSRGVEISRVQLQELPIKDGSAAELIVLAPGIANTTDLRPRKAAFSQGLSEVSSNGTGESRNDFTVDGIPNNVSGGGTGGGDTYASSYTKVGVAFPSEAIQEVRVETNVYDATYGHSPGAVFNFITQAGTNQFHGEAHEYLKNRAFNANDFFSELSGLPKPDIRDNRFGFSIGGPVRFPNVYDGKNRTFFFFAFEDNPFRSPFTSFSTVPTPAELNGDFSALLALNPQYQIYDPKSTTLVNGTYTRKAFPNNIIPADSIDPVAKKLLRFWPAPNAQGTADGRNNFFFNNPDTGDWYRTYTGRFDHVFSDKHRIYGHLTLDKWIDKKDNLFNNASTGIVTERVSRLVGINDVYAFSPDLVLSIRAGHLRQPFTRAPRILGIDYTTLGFPSQLATLIPQTPLAFPVISFSNAGGGSYRGFGKQGYFINNNESESIAGILFWQKGRHGIRLGAEFRTANEFEVNQANSHGVALSFSQEFTNGPTKDSPGQTIGGELAAFLLGVPSGGSLTVSDGFQVRSNWYGFFLHDDWKVSRRLSVNVGIRYELETPMTERRNRMTIGFDGITRPEFAAAAEAAYAQNPVIINGVPLPFQVRGGYRYASPSNRGAWNLDTHNIMPRFGLAYQLDDRTVVRGGFGLYFDQLGIGHNNNPNQPGFSRTTQVIPTLDFGLTYQASLSNPFPNNQLLQPVGSTLGVNLDAGNSLGSVGYMNARNPYTMHWSFGVQRLLPGKFFLDTSYVGSKSVALPTDLFGDPSSQGIDINAVPAQYLTTSPTLDQANLDFLNEPVANPFAGMSEFAGTDMFGQQVPRANLLVPHPQFHSIHAIGTTGMSWYHSLQVHTERRMSGGFTFTGNYTWSRNMKATDHLNPTDTHLEHVIETTDPGHAVTLAGIYELPFGMGRFWGSSWHGVTNAVLGGWQFGSVFKAQRGQPAFVGDLILLPGKTMRDAVLPKSKRTWDQGWFSLAPFNTDPAVQPGPNHIRTLPTGFSFLRGPSYYVIDTSLSKSFSIGERGRLQFRAEAYNVINHVNLQQYLSLQFDNPGLSDGSTNGQPRVIQLGLRLSF